MKFLTTIATVFFVIFLSIGAVNAAKEKANRVEAPVKPITEGNHNASRSNTTTSRVDPGNPNKPTDKNIGKKPAKELKDNCTSNKKDCSKK